jgi:cytoskeleton protein RodZ
MSSSLKEIRLALGKDLKEFAELTRIRESHLKAIEEGRFEKLPPPVYARGYIREYARVLAADPEPVLAAYNQYLLSLNKQSEQLSLELSSSNDTSDHQEQLQPQLTGLKTQSADEHSENEVIQTQPPDAVVSATQSVHEQFRPHVRLTVERELQLQSHTMGGRSLKWSLIFFVILLAIGAATLYFMYGMSEPHVTQHVVPDVVVKEPVVVRPGDQVQKPSEATLPQPAVSESVSENSQTGKHPEQQATPASPQSPSASRGKKHVLTLSAIEKVWVQLIVDKTDKKEMLLNPGESFRIEGNDSFRLWIGNAGGLKLIFDGKEIAHGGKPGQSLRLVLPDVSSQQQQQSQNKDDLSANQQSVNTKVPPSQPTNQQ